MTILASGIALFLSGAVFGASIDHWYAGAGIAFGPAAASLLIAVLAAEALRRAIKPRN